MKNCLICERKVSTNGLINHIANHLNYNRHKCTKCSFRSVSVEEMVDHQNQTGHLVEFDSLKNWYLERVCQLIYSDFDYVEKHGIETIRNLGSAFGDRKRLLNLLRSEDVHSEREVQSVSSEEAVETVEDQSTQPTTPQQGGVDLLDHWTRSIEQMITPKNTRNNLTSNTGNSSRTPKITKQLSNNSENTEYLTVEQKTKQLLAELQNQITNGIPKRQCQLCIQKVDNDYRSMKNHVFHVHFKPPHRLNKFMEMLEKCFKKDGSGLFISNDLQCNVCGREFRSKNGRFNHVSICHSNYIWKCIYNNCDYKLNSFVNFLRHLQIFHHKKSHQLEHFMKDRYIRLRADYELKLTPLVRKCFPFDLPAIIISANSFVTDEDILGPVDEIVSNFMPTREIKQQYCSPCNQENQPNQANQQTPAIDEEMVDPSSDEEDKNKSAKKIEKEEKKKKKNVKNLTEISKNQIKNGNKFNKNVVTSGQLQKYNQGYYTPRTFNEGLSRIFGYNSRRHFRRRKRLDDEIY